MSLCDRCDYNVNDDCVKDRMSYPEAVNCNAFRGRWNSGHKEVALIPQTKPQTTWEIFNDATPPKCVFIADFTG